jgi:hypothetical protein
MYKEGKQELGGNEGGPPGLSEGEWGGVEGLVNGLLGSAEEALQSRPRLAEQCVSGPISTF